jgi:Resolvase, N terminal domain
MRDLSSLCLAGNRMAIYRRTVSTSAELPHILRPTVEERGDMVVSTFQDDAGITGRGKYAGWHRLIAHLDTVDRIVVADAGDLPGRSVADLLKILGLLRDRGVTLHLHNIETGTTTSVTSFRRTAAPSCPMPSGSGRRRPWRRANGLVGPSSHAVCRTVFRPLWPRVVASDRRLESSTSVRRSW